MCASVLKYYMFEFDGIVDWALNNGLRINPTKSKVVNFVTEKSLVLPTVMDGTSSHRIEEVYSAKLLGPTIDDNMNWATHCRQVLTVARQRLHCVHVMRRAGASAQLLRTLYCALIRSAISYAFPVCACACVCVTVSATCLLHCLTCHYK